MVIPYSWREKFSPAYWRELIRTTNWRQFIDREIWAERLEHGREKLKTFWQTFRDINWREELKPTKLRKTIEQNKRSVSIGCVFFTILVLGFTAWATFRSTALGSYTQQQARFIDEETGREYMEPNTAVPPLAGRGGKPTLVRAIYYYPDGCKTSKLAYMEKYTDEAKAALDAGLQPRSDPTRLKTLLQTGHLIRNPQPGAPWVSVNSPEGLRILQSLNP